MSRHNPKAIDKVVYNFKKKPTGQIDIVPIAHRLLTPVNIGRTTAPHRTDFYRIIWFQQGDPVHMVDFQEIAIKSPAMLFVEKDKVHRFDLNTCHDGKVLIFTDDFFVQSAGHRDFLMQCPLFNGPAPVLISKPGTELASMFQAIAGEIANDQDMLKQEILHSMLTTFLYVAQRFLGMRGGKADIEIRESHLTGEFLGLVEKHFKERFSIEQYSNLLHVSVSQLNQAVIREKGKTGKQVLTEMTMLEARRLLAFSRLSIKEIGYELGFEQSTNFIKFFHKNAGQTPSEFQKGRKAKKYRES